MSTSATIVQRVWNYCNVLRDDGMSYGDYLEQLTYLLFLKMADEMKLVGKASPIPATLGWKSLLERDGDDLEVHYRHILTELGKGAGLIPVIFRKAQNEDSANLPAPDVLAREIAEDLEAALAQFAEIAEELKPSVD